MTFFSVIIPVYNIERYLSSCIDSIISQSYEKLQIILIDDGSKDKSGEVCDRYASKDNRIEVIHQKNSGVVSARMKGISSCKGDYIICIDGDDWIENGFFEKLDVIVNDYAPDVICTGYKSVGRETTYYSVPYTEGIYYREKIEEKIYPSLICNENGIIFPQHLWAKAFKNNKAIRGAFDIDRKIDMGEDSATVIIIASMIESLYVLNEPVYCYRYNPESLSKSKKALKWENPKIWYKEIISKADNNRYDFTEQINRSGALSVFYIAASQFNVDGKYIDISKTIKNQLKDQLFQRFIKHARFNKKCKQRLKVIVLKYRLIFLLKLFCDTYYKNRK